MNGTGKGGAATDGPPQERGAVEGAETIAVAGGLERPGVRSAPLGEVLERPAEGRVEALELGLVEAAGRSHRVEAGLEQRLIDQEVAEAGNLRLVHEPSLEGDAAGAEHGAEAAQGKADGVGAEAGLLGVEVGAAEAARVPHPDVAAVGGTGDEAGPPPQPPPCWRRQPPGVPYA